MQVDYLIVGAGFAGCVLAERIASQCAKRVLIVERRRHIGGNAYDYYNEHGILVHKYGPHVFHTNVKQVVEYLSEFTQWLPYCHRVLAMIDGMRVPIPFNLNSLYALLPATLAKRAEESLVAEYQYGASVPILDMMASPSEELRWVAQYIYDSMFAGYCRKQWGMRPEDLDPSVSARVPVRISRDDRYFRDVYQLMPAQGYTQLLSRMIERRGIQVLLNADFREVAQEIKYERLIYTGQIDEYCQYVHGELPYRSVRFDLHTFNCDWYQEAAVVNYPNEHDFTRITECKRLTGQRALGTTVAFEFPQDYIPGRNEPYYPVPTEGNQERFARYKDEVAGLKGNVIFLGRLAEYRYYNMDQVVARALAVFEREIINAR